MASIKPLAGNEGATQRAAPAGIQRAPSGEFKRTGSTGSVTFDDGANKEHPHFARASSNGSKKSGAKKRGFLSRTGSVAGITRVPSVGGIAGGGSGAWAKLRALAAIQAPAPQDAFSRVSSGFQRVPSANAPGSLGILLPITMVQTLTEEQSLRQSRQDIKKWKEQKTTEVQERMAHLEARMTRLSILDERIDDIEPSDGDDGSKWSNILPGVIPDKLETETQKFLVAKQASNTMKRMVEGDLAMPPETIEHYCEQEDKPSTANTEVAANELNEFGWKADDPDSKSLSDDPDSSLSLSLSGSKKDGDEIKEEVEDDEIHFAPLPKKQEYRIEFLEDCCERSCSSFLCGGFSHTSLTRHICFSISTSQFFQFVSQVTWLANISFMAASPEMNRLTLDRIPSMDIPEIISVAFNLFCILILFIEVVSGIIAFGLIHGPTAWLKLSAYNKIDLLVLLVCLAEGISSLISPGLGLIMPTLRPFRTLRIFKIVGRWLKDFDIIIVTLDQSFGQIATTTTILLFYYFVFVIFGMAMYQKSFRRACVAVNHLVPSCASDFSTSWNNTCAHGDFIRNSWVVDDAEKPLVEPRFCISNLFVYVNIYVNIYVVILTVVRDDCSGYPLDKPCKYWNVKPSSLLDYPVDAQGRYHTCQLELFRAHGPEAVMSMCQDVGNPMMGFMHFDNVWGALIVVAQVGIPDSQYEPLTRSLAAEPHAIGLTAIFYVFLISLIFTFVNLGLLNAIICKNYALVDEEYRTKILHVREDSLGYEAQTFASKLLERPWFQFLLFSSILLQSVALALDGYSTKEWLRDVFGSLNVLLYVHMACYAFFGVETMLHFFTDDVRESFFSIRRFAKNSGQVLWLVVILLSTLGYLLMYPSLWPQFIKNTFRLDEAGIVLRSLVCLRVYRIMEFQPTIKRIRDESISALRAMFNISIFLVLSCFCTAITGMYLIGDKMSTRSNFHDIKNSMVTAFQVFIGDSWTGVMYDAMSAGESHFWSMVNGIFVIVWLFYSVFVIGNLFIAAILVHIRVSRTLKDISKEGTVYEMSAIVRRVYKRCLEWSFKHNARASVDSSDSQIPQELVNSNIILTDKMTDLFKITTAIVLTQTLDHNPGKAYTKLDMKRTNVILSENRSSIGTMKYRNPFDKTDCDEPVLCGFSKTFVLRKFCIYLDENTTFNALIYVLVVANCAIIAMAPQYSDIPGYPHLLSYNIVQILDIVFTIFFLVECIVRCMSRGFYNTRNAYLSSGWNRLDFIILIFSLLALGNVIANSGVGKVLRSMRILRILRAFKLNQGMMVLIKSFLGSFRPISYVVIFSFFSYSVFALMGMSLFGGRFYYCNTPGAEYPSGMAECTGSHALETSGTAYMVPRCWNNPSFSFDDFPTALLTIFRMGTFKYVNVIQAAMDVTFINKSPEPLFSHPYAIFFFIFLILGSLFVTNTIVAFTVESVHVNQGRTEADFKFTECMHYIYLINRSRNTFPPASNSISQNLRKAVDSQFFSTISALCIAVNALFMLTDHADASTEFERMMTFQNDFFYAELVFEVLLRLIADGPRHFVSKGWNRFDAIVAAGLTVAYIGNGVALGAFAKGFRLMRLLRLMVFMRSIRIVLDTVVVSMPQLVNVMGILFLVMFSLACLGISLYSETRFQGKLGPHANFRTWENAMKVLYQILVGEEWQDLMAECSIEPPFCTKQFDGYSFGDCGNGTILTPIFFVVVKVLCQLMVLNLLIGTILDHLNTIQNEIDHVETDDWSNGPSFNQLNEVADAFQRYSAGTGKVSLYSIIPLLHSLKQPIGFRNKEGERCMDLHERAVERLIRAELNLVAIKNREMHKQRGFRRSVYLVFEWLKLVLTGQREKPRDKFTHSVDFKQFITSLMAWRTPWLVSADVKRQRQPLLEEVVFTTHMLTVLDFFKLLGTRKAKQKVLQDAHTKNKFLVWAQANEHYARRIGRRSDWTVSLRRAKTLQRALAGVDPSKILQVDMKRIEWTTSSEGKKIPKFPKGMVLHREAVRWGDKGIHSGDGLAIFLQKFRDNFVVLRFIDAVHAKMGLISVDFPEECFDAWKQTELRKDCFLEPPAVQVLTSKPYAWNRVDFEIQVPDPKDPDNPVAPKQVGTLIDLQGYVGDDCTPGCSVPMTLAAVRLHLSKIFIMHDVSRNPEEEDQEEAVLEVVGYVRKNELRRHH